MINKICEGCNKPYQTKWKQQKYCDLDCQDMVASYNRFNVLAKKKGINIEITAKKLK